MLSVGQCVFVVTATIVVSLVFLTILRRLWPAPRRSEHNDIIGWQISVLGTTYAVILAFMLWNVWNNFQIARINSEMEANYLVDLFRIAAGLAPEQSKPIRALCREYAAVAVNEEWPAMEREQLSAHGFGVTQGMWMCWWRHGPILRREARTRLRRIVFSSRNTSKRSAR